MAAGPAHRAGAAHSWPSSHDRAFIDAVATRIVELDRALLRSWPGNFAAFDAARQRELEAEAVASARADKLLAQEEAWIRKGVEARRTRSVSRIGRLDAAARPAGASAARSSAACGWSSIPACRAARSWPSCAHVAKRFGDKTVVDGFSATLLRGDKVGLDRAQRRGQDHAAQAHPRRARARRGHGAPRHEAAGGLLRPDAHRRSNLDATLADTISPGSEWVEIGGQRKHVMSYLGDFLFSPARANSPVRTLSGGERNRLLLARLFALPANVLVLDEPTNDLDIETLELLEELLQGYAGTVFLVSHDRRFLDNVVTSTIAWEGDDAPGRWREYEGGIETGALQRARSAAARRAAAAPDAQARHRRARPPRASSATRSSASSTSCPRTSRRSKPSRRRSASASPPPSSTPPSPSASPSCKRRYAPDRRRADGRPGTLGDPGRANADAHAPRRRCAPEGALAADRRSRIRARPLVGRFTPAGSRLAAAENYLAAGCVRLTISPACRYSAFSSRIARSRSKPGQSAMLAQIGGLPLQAPHGGLERAGQRQVARFTPGATR